MTWLRLLFRRRRFHHRGNGPVVINPDTPEVIHVWGGPEYSWLDHMDGLK